MASLGNKGRFMLRKRAAPNILLKKGKVESESTKLEAKESIALDIDASKKASVTSVEEPPLKQAKLCDEFPSDSSTQVENICENNQSFSHSDCKKDKGHDPDNSNNNIKDCSKSADLVLYNDTINPNLRESIKENDDFTSRISNNITDNESTNIKQMEMKPSINKVIKRRIGPRLMNKNDQKNFTKTDSKLSESVVNKPSFSLESQFIPENLVTEKSNEEECNVMGYRSLIKSSSEEISAREICLDHITKDKPREEYLTSNDSSTSLSKLGKKEGVVRIFLNCWPKYPLDDLSEDPFFEGQNIEDLGKICIFSNKKHRIAYCDMKQVVNFENIPKNCVYVNFNKLIKEEFVTHEDENVAAESLCKNDEVVVSSIGGECSETYNESHDNPVSCANNDNSFGFSQNDYEITPNSSETVTDIIEKTIDTSPNIGISDSSFNMNLGQESLGSCDELIKSDIVESLENNIMSDSENFKQSKPDNSHEQINTNAIENLNEIESTVLNGYNCKSIDNPVAKDSIAIKHKKTKKDNNEIDNKESVNQENKSIDNDAGQDRKCLNEQNSEESVESDNTKRPYKLRFKKPPNINDNVEFSDNEEEEDIFFNSEDSDVSEYTGENKIKLKSLKTKKMTKKRITKKGVDKPKKKEVKKPKEKVEKKSRKINLDKASPFCKLGLEVKNKNKWDDEGNCAEPEKLELKDFIYFVPKNEPMTQEDLKKESDDQEVNGEEEIIKAKDDVEEENHGPKLIVKDGKIMIDPNSTKIKQTPIFHPKLEKIEKVKEPNDPWEIQETMRFYGALWKYGIDFSILAGTFPKKSRESIKKKFNYEERYNKSLLTKTLTKKLGLEAILREIILIDSLEKVSRKKNVANKPAKEPKKPMRHCLLPKKKRKRPVKNENREGNAGVSLASSVFHNDDSCGSLQSYISENEIIISEDVNSINLRDIITFSTNVVYNDMNIVESVSFHPSAMKPVDINVTICHESDSQTYLANSSPPIPEDTSLK